MSKELIKILFVEDEKQLLENIKEILEFEGYKVETASNGVEGIEKAKEFEPDLIISDIMMPKMDGFEFKENLNLDLNTYMIPFLFLTAKTEIASLRKGMNLGADDYLVKPFSTEELIKAINLRLQKRQKLVAKISEELERTNQGELVLKIGINKKRKLVNSNSIICIIAQNQYSIICISEGKEFLVRKSLNNWENVLPNNFLRIHRSYIINKEYLEHIEKNKNEEQLVSLKNCTKNLPISRRVLQKLNKTTS